MGLRRARGSRGSMADWQDEGMGARAPSRLDRNITQCRHLAEDHVELLEAELETLELEPASYDLVHTRNVLMHLEDADRIIAKIVGALRPGGRLLLEEADYSALAGITSATSHASSHLWWGAGPGPGRCRSPFPGFRSSTSRSPSMRPCSTAPRTKPAFWAHTIMSAGSDHTTPRGSSRWQCRLGRRPRPGAGVAR